MSISSKLKDESQYIHQMARFYIENSMDPKEELIFYNFNKEINQSLQHYMYLTKNFKTRKQFDLKHYLNYSESADQSYDLNVYSRFMQLSNQKDIDQKKESKNGYYGIFISNIQNDSQDNRIGNAQQYDGYYSNQWDYKLYKLSMKDEIIN